MSGPYRHISTITQGDVLVLTVELDQVKDYVLAEELRYELASVLVFVAGHHLCLVFVLLCW